MIGQSVVSVSLMMFAAGCGDGRPTVVPVAGRVLIDGQPLKNGAIRVLPENARPASARIQSDGTFRLTTFEPDDGCVTGTHSVEVTGFELLNNFTARRWHAPARYSQSDTSGLTLEVNEPTDDVTINLSWGNEKPFTENLIRGVAPGKKPAEGTF